MPSFSGWWMARIFTDPIDMAILTGVLTDHAAIHDAAAAETDGPRNWRRWAIMDHLCADAVKSGQFGVSSAGRCRDRLQVIVHFTETAPGSDPVTVTHGFTKSEGHQPSRRLTLGLKAQGVPAR